MRPGIPTVQQIQPDLSLLDIQMPATDGAVVRVLREIAWVRETPIVTLTSYAMPGNRGNSLAAGCNSYIEKSVNPETIMHFAPLPHSAGPMP